MFIASKLKKQNIVEYLLYMWQIEDLIRAFGLNMNIINEKIVEPYHLSAEDKKKLYEWYESLIDMMQSENVKESGHIQINKNIIIQLNDFHTEIMKSGTVSAYNSKYYSLLPYFFQLRQKQNLTEISDIELCFNFLYGIMALRMKNAEINPATLKVKDEISKFMALLNKFYLQYVNGELQLEEE
ncbi:MAG: DUF4924 family protein [Paludibacteraceae bacterium]